MTKKIIRKALIVDDENEIGLLLGHKLTKQGISNNYAANLTDALELIKTDVYDLIFLDINLPDGNGLDIIPDIKTRNAETKIVVISAYNIKEDKERAYELGADRFLGKPFSSSVLNSYISGND